MGSGGSRPVPPLNIEEPRSRGALPSQACKPDSVERSHPSERPTWTSAGDLRTVLLGLAPGGVCLDAPRHRDAGALLPHLFTLACARLTCGRAIGGMSLWHFPAGFPGSGFPTTLALRCPDFPRRVVSPAASARLALPTVAPK